MKTTIKSVIKDNKQVSLIQSTFDEDVVYIVQISDTRTDKVEWINTDTSLDKASDQFDLLLNGLEY
jgi:hypothetical protein